MATAIAYGGWLAWDRVRYVDAEGYQHGPYQAWQVVGLALTLGVVAAVGGWRRCPWTTAAAILVVLTVVWSVNAMVDSATENASLWPVGAGMVALGTLGGTTLVAALTEALRARKDGFSPSPPFTAR